MHSQNGQGVSRFYRDVFEFLASEQFLIDRPILKCGCDASFAIVPVIDEGVDRNACHQLGKAADVVGVIVSDQDVIYSREAGFFGDGDDAVGIAAVIVGPAGINKEGLSVGSNEERGLAALDVDKINA
jgi:hypothetical protein